ncbi:hypothetical protein [Acidovorax sp. sic0104]|uniref:hypothetical protein n=1 Tax=Acidovorax sp. sic0104 TaxID=2854784 RepID=UPI001C464ABB|nr:hypothetical protein [Acidovorax sp. sic0104]MBV7541733.1 hypothetical protein [Acidovorax sp. sic0104]
MFSLVRPIAALAACAGFTLSAHALELAKYPQVFVAPQGVEVVLAPSADGKQALVRVSGINDPIDKVVFLSNLEQQGAGREVYSTRIDGRNYGLLHKNHQPYRGGDQYVVYLPGKRDGVPLAFHEEKTKSFKVADLQTSFERQQKQGLQDKLARFDRNKRLAGVQADLTKTDQEASAACGVPVKTTVDWASIDDEKLQTLSIGSFCGVVASQLESMCSNTPAFKAKASSLGQVQCRFAPELKIRVEGSQVVFSTEKDAPNQDDFVRQFLRNQ